MNLGRSHGRLRSVGLPGVYNKVLMRRALQDIQVQISRRLGTGKSWPLLLFKDRTPDSVAIVQKWLQPLVQEALEKKASTTDAKAATEDSTFLSHLASSTDGMY